MERSPCTARTAAIPVAAARPPIETNAMIPLRIWTTPISSLIRVASASARTASAARRLADAPKAFSVTIPCSVSRNSAPIALKAPRRARLLRGHRAIPQRRNDHRDDDEERDDDRQFQVPQREDEHRRRRRDDRRDQRRQPLAEVGLQRLDALDEGRLRLAGPRPAGVARAEFGELREERDAQPLLRRHGRRLRDDLAGPQQPQATEDQRGDRGEPRHLLADAGPVQQLREDARHQQRLPDVGSRDRQPHRDRRRDPPLHAVRQARDPTLCPHASSLPPAAARRRVRGDRVFSALPCAFLGNVSKKTYFGFL